MRHRSWSLLVILLISTLVSAPLAAQSADEDADEAQSPPCSERNPEACDRDEIIEWVEWSVAAGPDQVERRLSLDALPGDPLFGGRRLDEWFAYKARVEKRYGVTWGTDYIAAWLRANESLGEQTGFGGALRFFGVWEALETDSTAGSLIWKVEHRHAYGSKVSPQALADEIGYAGLVHLTLSDQRTRLSNLYWRQSWKDSGLVLVGGWTDSSDYVDVYTLASPWTNFFNYAFSTGSAAMPVPNEGLALAAGGFLNDHVYAVAGFADANSDPHRPGDSITDFFDDFETFKHVEIGWSRSKDNAWLNNAHVTLWQVDERTRAGVPDGWGVNLSWSRLFADFWTVFVRGGYADDGGSILQKSLSAGGAVTRVPGGNQFGLAVNWGEVNESTYGPGLDDQVTVEAYYRIQLWEELALTPDVQFIRNPALNPEASSVWVLGLRARLAF